MNRGTWFNWLGYNYFYSFDTEAACRALERAARIAAEENLAVRRLLGRLPPVHAPAQPAPLRPRREAPRACACDHQWPLAHPDRHAQRPRRMGGRAARRRSRPGDRARPCRLDDLAPARIALLPDPLGHAAGLRIDRERAARRRPCHAAGATRGARRDGDPLLRSDVPQRGCHRRAAARRRASSPRAGFAHVRDGQSGGAWRVFHPAVSLDAQALRAGARARTWKPNMSLGWCARLGGHRLPKPP